MANLIAIREHLLIKLYQSHINMKARTNAMTAARGLPFCSFKSFDEAFEPIKIELARRDKLVLK
jgi:hypothetical protein